MTFNQKLCVNIPRIDIQSLIQPFDETAQYEGYGGVIEQHVQKQFHQANIGAVSRVDLLRIYPRDTNNNSSESKYYFFCQAFVHFDHWYDTPAARTFQATVVGQQTARLSILPAHRKYWIVNVTHTPLTKDDAIKEKIIHDKKHLDIVATQNDV